jgi:hypothetical protein
MRRKIPHRPRSPTTLVAKSAMGSVMLASTTTDESMSVNTVIEGTGEAR